MRRSLHEIDPRRRKTRQALQSAFITLALRRRYQEIRIDDILAASGVGRSTFYEHFASKNALLVASMENAISLFAGTPMGEVDASRLATLLAHLWQNRALARNLFQGTALRVIRTALVSQTEARLKRLAGIRLRLPTRLAAHALADGVLSPILAWLCGEASCEAFDLAVALKTSTEAGLAAIVASARDENGL